MIFKAQTEWVKPTELPDLRHCDEIVIDLETYDPDLKKLEWYQAFTNVAANKIDYLRMMLSNGEKIGEEPRITISTIHSAKGGEADNVVLFLNQTTNTMKSAKKSIYKQDEEYRVWYVGVTRTIQNLYLVKCKNKRKEFII